MAPRESRVPPEVKPCSCPQTPAATDLLLISTVLHLPQPSSKWNHVIGGLLCLASVTWHHVLKVHPRHSLHQYFLLFTVKAYAVVRTDHILFIHSLADQHWLFLAFGYYE